MTSEEAKRILLLYRPHTADAQDAEIAAALELARRDPELGRWLEQQAALQQSLRAQFREIPVPEDLKEAILAGRKIVRPALWWQSPAWLAAAAAIALLLGLGVFWMRSDPLARFSVLRSRMVRMALHEYQMDIVTNDLRQVRQHLAQKGSPADFAIPRPLEGLSVTGGGHIRWGASRSRGISMVCFDRGDKQMLFLFVVDSSAIRGEPGERPELKRISQLQTAAWSRGANTYILAGPDDSEFLRKYAPQ